MAEALTNAYQGRVDDGIIFAGENAYRCDKISTVPAIFEELLAHFEQS